MTFSIYECSGPISHRDGFFDAEISDGCWLIGDIPVFIARMRPDSMWWIIPRSYHDDAKFTDMGPYDTAETAVAMLKLSGSQR